MFKRLIAWDNARRKRIGLAAMRETLCTWGYAAAAWSDAETEAFCKAFADAIKGATPKKVRRLWKQLKEGQFRNGKQGTTGLGQNSTTKSNS